MLVSHSYQYLVQSYLGYKAIQDLKPPYGGSPCEDDVLDAMEVDEDDEGYRYFDWPINPHDEYGEHFMSVESVDLVYYNENGEAFEVEING